MQKANQDAPLLPLLLAWARYRLARFMISLRPAHSAAGIAVLVAKDGNPPGG
ncbi:hypothetical protein SAMN04488115_10286 [Bosea lathyri]|uniref:Uncharacterized protein n=1 Tax=Bosea lathyri TaxID=1036778 RepID=A0A1H5UZE5_9HYPH|nr:hypothetical protein SAMN04488115_10286 [Bosea lathyri]